MLADGTWANLKIHSARQIHFHKIVLITLMHFQVYLFLFRQVNLYKLNQLFDAIKSGCDITIEK